MSSVPQTSAVLLVRIWLEDGELVRARIIESLDLVDGQGEIVHVVGTTGEIEDGVHTWLERLSPAVTPR